MAWVFLAVSLVFAALAVNALRPVRREPLSAFSFAFGWVPSELPLHVAALETVVAVVLVLEGGLAGWPGWLALAVVVVTATGWIRLTVDAHEAGRVVGAALADAAARGAPAIPAFDPLPVWNRWWRLVLAVPFRWRGIRRIRNIDYWGDGIGRHRLDILTRRRPADRAPVLVSIHGGAWVIGDKREQGIPLMHELVQRGWVCVAINYRLSPQATWPDQIVDCKRAIAWVRAHIAEFGGDPNFVAVTGGSAGGHLAALVALTPDEAEWQPGFEELDTSVHACLPFYGVYDMTGERSGAYGPGLLELLERRVMKVALADDPARFERASPDRRVSSSAPPMFVCHGTNDTLVPLPVARHFVAQLRKCSGAPVAYAELPSAQHAFEVMASIRSRHTTMGAVHFLEGVRASRTAMGPPVPGGVDRRSTPPR